MSFCHSYFHTKLPPPFLPLHIPAGSVVLELSKPTHAQSIRVVFDCKEKDSHKCINTVFLVESYVWQAKGKVAYTLSFGYVHGLKL